MTEITLEKGQSIKIEKGAFTGDKYYVGAGWDMTSGGPDIDIDLFAVELDGSGKFGGNNADIAFYANKTSQSGACQAGEDNRTGEGDGDDEYLLIDLSKVPASCAGVAICLNMYQGKQNGQNFGGVASAFVRLVRGDEPSGEAVAGFNLQPSKLAPDATAIEYVRFVRQGDGWNYEGKGVPLGDAAQGSGVDTAAKQIA